MEALPSLAVVIPLLSATALLAVGRAVGRPVLDLAGAAAAAATAVVCVLLATTSTLVVTWFGGWEPLGGEAIGQNFAIDPFGAGTAALAAVLTAASLLFSWRYFEAIGALYHTLMLLFLGGMVGFALTGDLFNLFVFFELLTTTGYALTAYEVERPAPLQGSLNFAVTNTIGAFLLVHGIGFLYGRTGTLNLAEIGRELGDAPPDATVIVAFLLISTGLFVKAAIVPFHFWLPDAHAVAPTPVSVLFSGVMIELGLYGWARVYWTVFSGQLEPHVGDLRVLLVAIGTLTAILGGVMALAQWHLKRLLAFSSVSHAGLILIGVGLLDAGALAGAGIYTLAHGAVKGALFLAVGILLHHHRSVDEGRLRGRGRSQPVTAAVFIAGGLGLAGLPPFGTTLGKQLIEEAAAHLHYEWVGAVFVVAGALTAGAVLRAAGRVFFGWGPPPRRDVEQAGEEPPPETDDNGTGPQHTPAVMLLPAAALVVLAVAIGLAAPLAGAAESAAERFVDVQAYQAAVMDGATVRLEPRPGVTLNASAMVLGALAAGGAVAIALGALNRDRIPQRLRRPVTAVAVPALTFLERLQSGHVGDYVAWITFGAAALGGSYLLALR
ncbi:MAG: NADH-quinone oxidoreductase subunit D [Actinomycetota bacterium]|nr:NADH-quinone oxidoreductase subunit D [Actinomycetota bacterium]